MDEVCQSTIKELLGVLRSHSVQTFISPDYPDKYSFNPSNSLVYNTGEQGVVALGAVGLST